MKLTIELVPSSCFYSNVRSEVSKGDWDLIRKSTYSKAGYICEICGGKGKKHPVECHEIWQYDDKKRIQKLIGFISLCPDCHRVKHIGLAELNGYLDVCIDHLIKINGISREKALLYINECKEKWHERSQHDWTLDISYLDKRLKHMKEDSWLV